MRKLCFLLMALVALGLGGCGDETVNSSLIGDLNDKPTFTLFGEVTDGQGVIVSGAKVSLWVDGGWRDSTSDSKGVYSFKGVPYKSDVILEAAYTGKAKDAQGKDIAVPYQTTKLKFTTPADDLIGSVTELWLSRGNGQVEVSLIVVRMDYTLKGEVYAFDKGPAAGATVVLDMRNSGFNIFKFATTDANGAFEFTDLPQPITENGAVAYDGNLNGLTFNAVNYELMVLPYDSTGDGQVDFGTVKVDYYPYNGQAPGSATAFGALVTAIGDLIKISLNGPIGYSTGAPTLVYSNIQDGYLAADESITFIFDRTLQDLDLLHAYLRVELKDDGGRLIDATHAIENGVKLVVTPTGGLRAGNEFGYNITVESSNNLVANINFYVPLAGDKTVKAITGLALDYTTAPKFDWDTRSFNLKWNADVNAEDYVVYAKDNGKNVNWTEVAYVNNYDQSQKIVNQTVTLPAKFDTYEFDGLTTPLEGKQQVTFVIVGINAEDRESPLTGASQLIVADTKPQVAVGTADLGASTISAVQNATANNVGGTTDKKVRINVSFSEYMDVTTAPVLTFGDGPDANNTTPATSAFVWNDDLQTGYFEFVIDKDTSTAVPVFVDTNATQAGDTWKINFSAVKDSSGNSVPDDPATAGVDEREINGVLN